MKKAAAILFCALLLYNWGGYRLLLSYLQDQANEQLEVLLDNRQYDESQLISVKVPVRYLSAYCNPDTFERISGQVMIDGIQYQYVKKRFYNDSLEFVCIPNYASTRLLAAQDNFFKRVNDLQPGGQSRKSNSYTGSFKDFSTGQYITDDFFCLPNPGVVASNVSCCHFAIFPPGFRLAVEHPPDRIS